MVGSGAQHYVRGIDIDEILRCGYRFFRAAQEGVPVLALKAPAPMKIAVEPGQIFETDLADAIGVQETTKDVPDLIGEGAQGIYQALLRAEHIHRSIRDQTGQSQRIRIYGRPDLLVRSDGKQPVYYPVEIKSYAAVTEVDQIRVEYYSYLMHLLYPGFSPSPSKGALIGYIWPGDEITRMKLENGKLNLKRGRDAWEPVYFRGWDHLQDLIEFAWALRNWEHLPSDYRRTLSRIRHNVAIEEQPESPWPMERIPECERCGLWSECGGKLTQRGALTLARYIGPPRAALIRIAGFPTMKHIYNFTQGSDARQFHEAVAEVLDDLVGEGWRRTLPESVLSRLVLTSIANVESRPVVVSPPTFPRRTYSIYIDTEYDNFSSWPFCAGVLIKRGRRTQEKFQGFFTQRNDFRKWLRQLHSVISRKYTDSTIFCWRGVDFEMLDFRTNTCDLYNVVDRSIVLPLWKYDIKGLSEYLGYKAPKSAIGDGRDCLALFYEHQSTRSAKRRAVIERRIARYNWSDVERLAFVHQELTRLATT